MRPATASAALFAALVLLPAPALAFPGSVRWGYGNCNTCHFNVAGGGVLTPYGRQLSKELLSTWGSDQESEFAYGAWSGPEWLALGGDFSVMASSTPADPGGHVDLVQADMEVALTRGRLLAVATAGVDPAPSGMDTSGLFSRRHYLQVSATSKLSLRAGRFAPNFGVWAGDPFAATRRAAGWDRDTYNVEANWIAPQYNLAATAIVGSADNQEAQTGVSFSGGLFFGGKMKVWLSAAGRQDRVQRRRLLDVAGVFGIGPHAYLLTEGVLQELRPRAGPGRGRDVFLNACFAYETVKGLYVLLVEEASWRGVGNGPVEVGHTFGPSLRWFPRSHIELQLRLRRRTGGAVSPENAEGVSLLMHYYP